MDSTTTTTFTTTSIPSTSTSHLHHPLLDPAQCTVVEFSSKKDPKFFEKKMAAERTGASQYAKVLELFEAAEQKEKGKKK